MDGYIENRTQTDQVSDDDFVDVFHRRRNNSRFHKIGQNMLKQTTFNT